MSEEVFAVVAGGGTAGHVSPGIAIAKALIDRGHPTESIHYVGSERGIETTMVPAAGLKLTVLPGRGIKRSFSKDNIGAVIGLLRAAKQSFSLLRAMRPKVVVALGGYASVPCAVAARFLKIPVVIAEQNAVPGMANKLVSRWAKECAVSFPNTDLPNATFTGNPVRDDVRMLDRRTDRAAARAKLGLSSDEQLVSVYGGSLGARRINRAAADAAERVGVSGKRRIRHIIGERDWDVEERPADSETYEAIRYESDMGTVLLASDVVVCRAGASTIAELAVTGTPSILIPLPHAPGDHQTENAKAMVTAGGAVLVPDAELDGDRFVAEVTAILDEPQRIAAMEAGAQTIAKRNAADSVAAIAEEHASG